MVAIAVTRVEPLAIAAFAVGAAYVPGIPSAASAPRWWAAAVLVPLLCEVDPRALGAGACACLAAGLSWALLSLLWTPVPAVGFGDLIELAILSTVLCAAAGARDLDAVMAAFCLGVGVSGIFAAAQWWGVSVDVPRNGPAGLFMNTEVAAESAAPALAWALARRRYFLAVPPLVAVAVSGSRLAVLAAAAGLLLAVDLRPRTKMILLAAVAVLAVAAVGGLGLGKASSGMTRMVLWGAGAMAFTPAGHGLGWWPIAFQGPAMEYAHSDPVQLLAELGLGAVPLLAVGLAALLSGASHAERSVLGCAAALSTFSFALHEPASAFAGAVAAGFALGRRRRLRADGLPRAADGGVADGRNAADGGEVLRGVA